MHFIIFTSDCDLSEVFHKAANYPDWSSCLSFKNESDQCGKETLKTPYDYYKTYSPVKAYEKILTKDFLVNRYFRTFFFHFKSLRNDNEIRYTDNDELLAKETLA